MCCSHVTPAEFSCNRARFSGNEFPVHSNGRGRAWECAASPTRLHPLEHIAASETGRADLPEIQGSAAKWAQREKERDRYVSLRAAECRIPPAPHCGPGRRIS